MPNTGAFVSGQPAPQRAVELVAGSTPAKPPRMRGRLYVKLKNGRAWLYWIDDDGTEYDVLLGSGGGGSGTNLDDLGDVAVSGPTGGQTLRHNGTQFVNAQLAHSDLSGLTTGDPHTQYALDTDLSAHTGDTSDAHAASAITNTPAGGIAATTVQAALNELDTEKAPKASPIFTGTADLSEAIALGGEISPAQLTADQNDWNPTGLATAAVIRASTDASRNLTGLAGGAARRVLILINAGSFNLVVKDESASSTAANRFALDGDLILGADTAAVLRYDSTSSRWRLLGVGKTATGGSSAHDHTSGDGSGVLTNDEHDGYMEVAEIAAPTSPAADKLRIYAKDSAGTTRLYYKRSDGTEIELGAAGALADHNHTTTAGDGSALDGARIGDFLEFTEVAAPTTPATGLVRIYAKADGKLYQKDDVGTETDLAATAGDSTYTAAYASRPAASNAGDLFFPSDGYAVDRDTGAAWVPWGPLFPLTRPPAVASWTWVNQGTATATDTAGGVYLVAPAQANTYALRALVKSTPATPYTITAYFNYHLFSKDFLGCGLCWRQSSDGKIVTFSSLYSTGGIVAVSKATDANTFSANYVTVRTDEHFPWLRIRDDGSNRVCSVSRDGQNWLQIHTVTRTDFLIADQVGIVANAQNAAAPNYDAAGLLLSWKES